QRGAVIGRGVGEADGQFLGRPGEAGDRKGRIGRGRIQSVDELRSRRGRIQPVAQPGAVASATRPGGEHAAIPVGVVGRAGGRARGVATVQLADHAAVGAVQRRAGRTAFGGAGLIPEHVQVVAAGGAGIALDTRRIVRVGDALFGRAWMVDAGGAREGDVAAIPAGPVEIELFAGRIVQFQQGEVRTREAGKRRGPGLVLRKAAVAVLAAFRAARRAAVGVLVVPVHHDARGRVGRSHAAVVRGQEVHALVVGGVVDQRARAVERAEARVRADRADLLAPAIAGGAHDIDVAAAGYALRLHQPGPRQPVETDVVMVDA